MTSGYTEPTSHRASIEEYNVWEVSTVIEDLNPPSEVMTLLYAGDVAILATLTDDDLGSIGLSASGISEEIAGLPDGIDRNRVAEIWQLCRNRDMRWIDALLDLTDLPAPWLSVVAGHWSIFNAYFDESYLITGAIGSRVGALLELTRVELTVTDVQSVFIELAEQIAQGKVSAFESAAFVVSSFAVGGALGIFGIPAAPLVGKLADLAGGAMVSVDDWVRELARKWLLAAEIAEHDRERYERVADSIRAEADRLRRQNPTTATSRKLRMLMAAHTAMTTGDGIAVLVTSAEAPDVVGLRLTDAKQVLQQASFVVEQFDALPPETGDRFPMVESRWVVCAQLPSGTQDRAVRLAFKRPDERVRMHEVMARLAR